MCTYRGQKIRPFAENWNDLWKVNVFLWPFGAGMSLCGSFLMRKALVFFLLLCVVEMALGVQQIALATSDSKLEAKNSEFDACA